MKRSIAPRARIVPALLAALLLVGAGLAAAPSRPAARAARFQPSPLAAEKSRLVDLNSASKAELMRLPAVGEAIADRIIAGRPWASKYDLVVKKVVTRGAYDKFSRYVVARQPGSGG